MSVQQQQYQIPRSIPSPTGRFSLECDRTNPGRPSSSPSQFSSTHNHSSSSSPTSSSSSSRRSALAKNKTSSDCLSSSAPSSASSLSTYSPFSSFEDDNDSNINSNTETTTPKPKRERPLSRYSSLKQQRQRWASWSSNVTSEQQPQQQQQHQGSNLPSVQEERLPQQHSFVRVSATSTTRTTTVAMTTDDNRDTPIASPASSMAVQTLTSLANSSPVPHTTAVAYNKTATACTATSTTTNNNYSSNPIMQTPTRQKSAKDRVVKREQRRHSSDDGLAFYRRSASSSPPTSCIVDNINNNKYAIPPKCRMVFHMRDEVPRPREEDKTELSEKRFYQYRPQPQPRVRIRSLYSSSDQGQEKGSMLSPLTSTSTPMKKPNSGKCAKMVSFKEPESWRDVTPPPPSHQPPSSLSSSAETEKQGDPHDTKQVRMLLTRLNIPTIMVTEPQQQKQSTSASASASTSTPTAVRRPMSEPILSGGSTVLSTSSPLSSSSSPSSSAHRHIQATRATSPPRFSSASSPSLSSSADGPLSSTTSRHHRSLSMTVQSTFSSPSSNVPRRMQAGQGPMVEESKTKSGNKFLRLWRSATQKYGNHHHHSHQSNGGVGFLGGKGSDLEPLVSMARE